MIHVFLWMTNMYQKTYIFDNSSWEVLGAHIHIQRFIIIMCITCLVLYQKLLARSKALGDH